MRKFLSCLLFVALVGCDDDDSSAPVDPNASGTIRLVNAVVDSPVLSATFNETAFSTTAYGQASPLQIAATPLSVLMDVDYVDPANVSHEVIDDFEVELETDRELNIILTGNIANADAFTVDIPRVDLEAGQAELVFAHAVPGVDAIDFYIVDPSADTISGSPAATITPSTASQPVGVSAGTHRILVTAGGSSEVIFDTGAFELFSVARRMVLAIAYYGPGDHDLRLVRVGTQSASAFPDERLTAAFRVINAVPDAGIDIRVDGERVFGPNHFKTIEPYHEVPAGSYTLSATLEGDPNAVVFSEVVNLVAGQYRTLVLAGSSSAGTIGGRLIFDDNRRVASEAQLRVVHAARDAGDVDFYTIVPGQSVSTSFSEFQDLAYLTNGELSIDPGAFDIAFTNANEDATIVGPERRNMGASGIYLVTLIEADGGGAPPQMLFGDDF